MFLAASGIPPFRDQNPLLHGREQVSDSTDIAPLNWLIRWYLPRWVLPTTTLVKLLGFAGLALLLLLPR